MDIKKGLKILQFHSETAKNTLTHIIEILDRLDELDMINPTSVDDKQDHIGKKDDALVDFYNLLQSFYDYQQQFFDELCSTGLETALTSKLIENDTDTDEVISRSISVYGAIFEKGAYYNTWEESDFKAKQVSIKTELKDRIISRLMREDELPDFKDRLVVSGLNKDFISDEPITLDKANRKATDWVYRLDLYLHNVCLIQIEVMKILDKAYELENPPKPLEPIFDYFQILRNNHKVRNAFLLAIEKGLMVVDGSHFKWMKKRQLLSYFCKVVSDNLIPDAEKTDWVSFDNMFIAKRGREFEVESNLTLSRCYTDYEQKTRTATRDTPPDGWEIINEIIDEVT